jgi:hypothetical protein
MAMESGAMGGDDHLKHTLIDTVDTHAWMSYLGGFVLKLRQFYHNRLAKITLDSEIISNLWSILAQNICVF